MQYGQEMNQAGVVGGYEALTDTRRLPFWYVLY
jgi:hypothetical protein